MVKRGISKLFNSKRSNTGGDSNDSQGIMGSGFGFLSGIVGHFGIGTTIRCDSDDESFYCTLTKITSTLMQFIILFIIVIGVIYAVYYFTRVFGPRKNKKS